MFVERVKAATKDNGRCDTAEAVVHVDRRPKPIFLLNPQSVNPN